MQLEPKDLQEKLEFDKILNLLAKECLGELGKEAALNILPDTDLQRIEKKLQEVTEMKSGMETNNRLPLAVYEDVSDDLRMLEVPGYVLPIEGLQRINAQLRQMQAISKYFQGSTITTFSALYDIIRHIEFDQELTKAIDKIIDEKGEIRPDASPKLASIRKQVSYKLRELEKVFQGLIQTYRKQGWLSDNVESIRNGRRVLSVPSEHKRKIRGIIHDESATGQTAFIEPEPVIDINNDIFDLETEERREIHRLLKELCALLHPFVRVMRQYQQVLIMFDLIQAKAKLALQMNAIAPRLRDEIFFGIWQGYHPLLFLKNKHLGKKTIPFDLTLLYDNRILLVSGPNAGGKSVTMKSVGLLQLMVQSGLLVPMRGDSEMGIFKKIFADIGDQQSLEDDLSTYSSRLQNMRTFLEKADKNTLVLIDEFGSGTDPKIGGAIAEAILEELNNKRVYGIITTHYSNLKIYAFKTKGIVNAAMHFNMETLSPTYELKVGRPGSSYAFEIAEKTGLPSNVMQYAKRRTGKNEHAVDQLLIDLQREKKEVEEKLKSTADKEKRLEQLIKNYENLQKELEFRRKKIKLDAKTQALQDATRENRELQKVIREIREEQKLEKAKTLAAQINEEKEKLKKEVETLHEKVYYEEAAKKKEKPIYVGDFVRMRTGDSSGEVEAINKKTAIVRMGDLRMTIPLRDLVHAREPLEVRNSTSIQTETLNENSAFESKIDIRGLRMGDAMKVLEDFVDQALLSNTNLLRIVHGKGDGILRKAVKRKLQEYKAISSVSHPPQEQGGDGVTIVKMD